MLHGAKRGLYCRGMKRLARKKRTSKRISQGRTTASNGDVPALVLSVLQAVNREIANRRQPYFGAIDALGLPFNKRTDDAIRLATLSGWLTHSVAITSESLALLKERGMASSAAALSFVSILHGSQAEARGEWRRCLLRKAGACEE